MTSQEKEIKSTVRKKESTKQMPLFAEHVKNLRQSAKKKKKKDTRNKV